MSEKERTYMEANRLAVSKATEEYFNDKNTWWMRMRNMDEEKLEQLPNEIVRKYAIKTIKTEELHVENELIYNKEGPFGVQIKDLKKL
jgi:hypothetical protein